MSNKEKLKNLIRHGKEIGYILKKDLDECLEEYSTIDKEYVIQTIDEMKIQLIKSPDEYDEYKYLSGEEAIKILQSLSDGTHKAFIKPEGKNEKD